MNVFEKKDNNSLIENIDFIIKSWIKERIRTGYKLDFYEKLSNIINARVFNKRNETINYIVKSIIDNINSLVIIDFDVEFLYKYETELYIDVLSSLGFDLRGKARNSENMDQKMDKDVIEAVHKMLIKVLQDVPPSETNLALRYVAEKASYLLEQQLKIDLTVSEITHSTVSSKEPTLTLPEEAPIKWAKRKTFVVSEIKDDYTRHKLEANPELEKQIRDSTNAKTFFNLVWKDYKSVLNQSALRGKPKTNTRKSEPEVGLDKTLFDKLYDELGKEELAILIPNKMMQIDNELSLFNYHSPKHLLSLASAANRRSK